MQKKIELTNTEINKLTLIISILSLIIVDSSSSFIKEGINKHLIKIIIWYKYTSFNMLSGVKIY